MPDDVEVLRLRALAKAKAARLRGSQSPPSEPVESIVSAPSLGAEMSQIWNEPGLQAQKGIGQLPTNPVAGALNVGVGAAKAVGAPFASAAAFTRRAAPPEQRFAQAGIEYGLGKVGEFVGGHARNATEYALSNLRPMGVGTGPGVSSQFAQEIAEPVGEAANMATQALVTGGVVKGMKSLPPNFGPPWEKNIRKGNVAFQQAIEPSKVQALDRPGDLQRMQGYLGDEQRVRPVTVGDVAKGGTNPSSVRQIAKESFPNIKQRIFEAQDEMVNRRAEAPLVGGVERTAKAVESVSNIYTQFIDVLKDKSILTEAEKWRSMGSINLRQARDMLRSLNAGLDQFYKKSNEGQAAAEALGKPIAEMEKAAASLRDQIAETLTQHGEDGAWYRERSLDYGAAARLEAAAEGAIKKAEIPPPPIFQRTAARLQPSQPGTIRFVGEETVGRFHTTDALAAKAMRRYAKSGATAPFPVPTPAPPQTAGLLGRGPIRVPQFATPGDAQTNLGGVPTPGPYIHYGVVSPSAPKQLPPIGGTTPPAGGTMLPGPGVVTKPAIPMGPVPKVRYPDEMTVYGGIPPEEGVKSITVTDQRRVIRRGPKLNLPLPGR